VCWPENAVDKYERDVLDKFPSLRKFENGVGGIKKRP
jgi:hypothetical protein